MRKQQSLCVGIGIGIVGTLLAFAVRSAAGASESDTMLYELRTYTAAEGKMPDLHHRFREHTMKLFEKHGIKNIAYWTPIDNKNTLIYVIAHKNKAAADQSWKEFSGDPEWKQVYKDSQKDGSLTTKVERRFLSPTDYSPMK